MTSPPAPVPRARQVAPFRTADAGPGPAQDARGRERPGDALVVVQPRAQLLQVVRTLEASCRLASGLHGGQQQGDVSITNRAEQVGIRTGNRGLLICPVNSMPAMVTAMSLSCIIGRKTTEYLVSYFRT